MWPEDERFERDEQLRQLRKMGLLPELGPEPEPARVCEACNGKGALWTASHPDQALSWDPCPYCSAPPSEPDVMQWPAPTRDEVEVGERNPVPGYMAHLPDVQQDAHRQECQDGTIYEDSMTAIGVPGGPYPIEECPVCVQDPFRQLRTVLNDQIDALEAQIATQTLSVRLQGQVDGLDWAVEQMEAIVKAIHERFHDPESQAAWNPPVVFGAEPAATGPASSQNGQVKQLGGKMYMRTNGHWQEISGSVSIGGQNAHTAMQQMQMERDEAVRRLREAEKDHLLQKWMQQQPGESRPDWKARTFAVAYGGKADADAILRKLQPDPTAGMSPGEAIQWYMQAYARQGWATNPTNPTSGEVLRRMQQPVKDEILRRQRTVDPLVLDLGIKRQIEGARNQFTFFDEMGAWRSEATEKPKPWKRTKRGKK